MRRRTVIVSDLHLDRWDQEQRLRFIDFLRYLQKEARHLIVNGDLLDLPRADGCPLRPEDTSLVWRLFEASRAIPRVTYVVGNHDLGVRRVGIFPSHWRLVYPRVRLLAGRARLHVEHGHLYDPLYRLGAYRFMHAVRTVTGVDPGKVAMRLGHQTAVAVHGLMAGLHRPVLARRARFSQPLAEVGGGWAVAAAVAEEPWPEPEMTLHVESSGEHGYQGDPAENARLRERLPRVLALWNRRARHLLAAGTCDYVLFGHIHHPYGPDGDPPAYINTGDWVQHSTVVEFVRGEPRRYEWDQGTLSPTRTLTGI